MLHKTRPDLALLLLALILGLGIIVLIALHDGIPPELWAVEFASLTGAGVAVQTAVLAPISTLPAQTVPAQVLPPPAGP